jgi:hypothetical protein
MRSHRLLRNPLLPLAATAAVAALLQSCMMHMHPPKDLDYSRERGSAGGQYRATIMPDGDSIPQGKLQRWTLHLETASGAPVDSATITVDGGMPQHGHGLPTKPLVTRHLGNGDHAVEGIKFNMGGWWTMKFRVRGVAGSDSIVFNIKL